MTALCGHTSKESFGYWKIQENAQSRAFVLPEVYIVVFQGKIVFADEQPLSWRTLQSQLLRYIPRLRLPALQSIWQSAQANIDQGSSISAVLRQLVSVECLFTHQDVKEALWIACLDLLDAYCKLEGKATFLSERLVAEQMPMLGFSADSLQAEMDTRQSQWHQLKGSVPSTQHIVIGNQAHIDRLSLTPQQRQHILSITQQHRSIDHIAQTLGSDRLKIAQVLAPLLQAGLATLQENIQSGTPVAEHPPSQRSGDMTTAPKTDSHQPSQLPRRGGVSEAGHSGERMTPSPPGLVEQVDIFVVDDSPTLLKQFEALVTNWGYSVRSCAQASKAVEELLICLPSIIFIDINMPEISGFQLLREIRLQPKISKIPVVILTAEESFSNLQRARWSRCDFLAKPVNTQDISSFHADLLDILSRCDDLIAV